MASASVLMPARTSIHNVIVRFVSIIAARLTITVAMPAVSAMPEEMHPDE